ncbi:hypothetical protein WMF37_07355 [Sorangium sp. So ce291]
MSGTTPLVHDPKTGLLAAGKGKGKGKNWKGKGLHFKPRIRYTLEPEPR